MRLWWDLNQQLADCTSDALPIQLFCVPDFPCAGYLSAFIAVVTYVVGRSLSQGNSECEVGGSKSGGLRGAIGRAEPKQLPSA